MSANTAEIYCTPPCAKRPDGMLEDKKKEGGYVNGGSDLLSSASFSKFVWMEELVFP